MIAEWHYGEGEPNNGPVSLEELKRLVGLGEIQPVDMVWKEGMPQWLPAASIEELFPGGQDAEDTVAGESADSPPGEGAGAITALWREHHAAILGLAAVCVGAIALAWFVILRPGDGLPDEVRLAMATLKANPTDPEAKLVVGKYRCFQQDDWDKGLPMLVQGSDAALKDLAVRDLRRPMKPGEQEKLADGWRDLAGDVAGLVWKGAQRRAVYWYRQAVPHLAEPAKAGVETRLKRLEDRPPDFEVLARVQKRIPMNRVPRLGARA